MMHTTTGPDRATEREADRETSGGSGSDGEVPGEVRRAIADAVTADTRRTDLLLEYAQELGPDPQLAHLDDGEVERAVRTGAAEIAAATCRWLEHLAELVVRGVWADAGASTPAAWASWALGMAPSTAREHVRVALRLRECPLVRDRFAAGRLSYSKVRAITRVATPETEQLLLAWSDAAPAHILERIIADARRQQRAGSEPDERDDLGLTRRWREDGTYELILRVDAGTGVAVEQHLDRLDELATADHDGEHDDDTHALATADDDQADSAAEVPGAGRLPRAHREADLVVGAIAAAVEAGPDDTSGADRHLVVLHTTAAELLAAAPDDAASAEAPSCARTGLVRDGRGRVRSMSARTLWRLACSARLTLAVDHDGHPADLGRAQRAPDARLRRLLLARDRTCRFPGCGATRYLHAHHVQFWSDDGPTDLDNLVLLCNSHHRIVHQQHWELRPVGPGRWTFHAPGTGRARPWAQQLPGASAEALTATDLTAAARAHAHDLAPAARDRLLQPPHWHGDNYDHSMTVGLLVERLATAA